ncbi:MAG: DegT/DnrJ/EryC1/StrS family aminotransferase, partial [Candidatus Hodarchaeota archaeon]
MAKVEKMKIPFFRTSIGEEEKKALNDVIDSGWVVLGEKSQEFEEKFAEYVGANHAVFVDSGTSALFLAVQYLIKHDLIKRSMHVPSLTFTSTAEVVENSGLAIQFEDVDLKSMCMDMEFKDSIGVHLTGNRCKSPSLIYDSAHRIEYNDVKDSKAIWCYSFYATKNLTTVTGGMIVTNDKNVNDWMRMARDHGLDLGTKERYTGKYKQYDVKFVGYRVKGDDLRAVIGLEQLKKL